MSKTILTAIFLSLFLSFSSPVLAEDFSPASNFYFLRTLWENIQYQFLFSLDQIFTYHYNLAQKKIKDSEDLIKKEKYDLVPVIFEEYKGQYKLMMESSKDKTNLQAKIIDLSSTHINQLINLYGQTAEMSSKRAIRSALFYLQKLNPDTDNLKLTCDFLEGDKKNTIWNEVERAILEEKYEKTCSNRR